MNSDGRNDRSWYGEYSIPAGGIEYWQIGPYLPPQSRGAKTAQCGDLAIDVVRSSGARMEI